MSSPTSASNPSASWRGSSRRRVEREHALDQIERARLLPERLAAAVQLDVRLLELLDRRAHLLLDRFRAPLRPPRIFASPARPRVSSAITRSGAIRRVAPLGVLARELRAPARARLRYVFAVHALRHVLERAHRLVARLPLGEARIGQLEERDVRCEALHHARAEEPARLVQRDAPRRAGHRRACREARAARLPRASVEAEQARVFVGLLAEIDELSAGEDLRANRAPADDRTSCRRARRDSDLRPLGLTRSRSI